MRKYRCGYISNTNKKVATLKHGRGIAEKSYIRQSSYDEID